MGHDGWTRVQCRIGKEPDGRFPLTLKSELVQGENGHPKQRRRVIKGHRGIDKGWEQGLLGSDDGERGACAKMSGDGTPSGLQWVGNFIPLYECFTFSTEPHYTLAGATATDTPKTLPMAGDGRRIPLVWT